MEKIYKSLSFADVLKKTLILTLLSINSVAGVEASDEKNFSYFKEQTLAKIQIPRIGVNTDVRYETVQRLKNFERLLLHGPVAESELTDDFCMEGGNTYLAGHSGPPSMSLADHSGVNIFESLTELKPGDEIKAVNKLGKECTYIVKGFEKVETTNKREVSMEVFKNIFFPDTQGKTWLTFQTCKKGSVNERVILRAEMIEEEQVYSKDFQRWQNDKLQFIR